MESNVDVQLKMEDFALLQEALKVLVEDGTHSAYGFSSETGNTVQLGFSDYTMLSRSPRSVAVDSACLLAPQIVEDEYSEFEKELMRLADENIGDKVDDTNVAPSAIRLTSNDSLSSHETESEDSIPRKSRRISRGSYRCSKCGEPKANHVCHVSSKIVLSQGTQTLCSDNTWSFNFFGKDRVIPVTCNSNHLL